MTLVSGPLSTVATTPSAVSQVNISINSPRTRGAGVMTPEVKTVAVTGGVFSSQIAPGPAVLTLFVGVRKSVPIPILVGDVESQTLAEVVDAARLATGETQESLTQFVQQALEARRDVLDARADALTAIEVEVTRAENAADLTWAWMEGKLLVESPAQSGLYVQHPGLFTESPAQSGLYEFNG